MGRTRTKLSLLLMASLTLMAVVPAHAADAAAVPPAVTAAGDSACASCLKCPCGCSPVAGAWVAKLSSPIETVTQTFKFAPVNDGCTKFVVNSQASTRSARVAKAWPQACDLTEFVGVACKDAWGKIKFTTIGYGVQRCNGVDQVLFIAMMTGMVDIPASCLSCDTTGTDGTYSGPCMEPDELPVIVYVSYFDAAQDVDRDGFPDCPCEEAVMCVCYQTKLKRVKLIEPCEESKSFVACLEKCKDCNSPSAGTGRAFFRILEDEQKICFVLTVQGLKDVTKAVIQVYPTSGNVWMDTVTLFPLPPETKGKEGDCDGLLACGCFYVKDCYGPWKNKKLADIEKAIEDGQATVLVLTKKCPKGELCGKIADP